MNNFDKSAENSNKLNKIELFTNDGETKFIELPPCPICGGLLSVGHIGNSYTKSQKLKVKCNSCRIERTDAVIRGGIDDLIRYQEKAWKPKL